MRAGVFALLFVASCGSPAAQAPAEAPPPAEAAQAEMRPGSDAFCARSFCGCWRETTLRYSARLVDADGAPVAGVAAVCHGETEPVAVSSADGVLGFEIATQQSPGCGYARCRNMTLADPQGRFADREITAVSTNGGVVALERR